MKKSVLAILVIVCAFAGSASRNVAAEEEEDEDLLPAISVPAACSGTAVKKSFNSGVSQGANLTQSAWNAVGQDPDRVDDFKTAIISAFASNLLPSAASLTIQCRYAGLQAGALDAIDTIQKVVIQQCILDGLFLGVLFGQLYCSLSISLGGLGSSPLIGRTANLGVCGSNFEVSCDAMFNSTTGSNAACAPFLTSSFATVLNTYRNNQCGY